MSEGRVKRLGGVFGDVAGSANVALNVTYINDTAAASDLEPSGFDDRMREVAPLNEAVKVRMPTATLGRPLDLQERNTAIDATKPVRRATKSGEGAIQLVEGISKGLVSGPERKSQEAGTLTAEFREDAASNKAGPGISARETKSVMATGTGQAHVVRVLEITEYKDGGAAVLEGDDASDRLHGSVQGPEDKGAGVGPRTMAPAGSGSRHRT